MEHIKLEAVNRFVGGPVEIVIHDAEGGDQVPAVRKTVKKVQLCPDSTHIRFYFDDIYFLAVPLASHVTESEGQWSATDPESGLTYTFKKVQVF
ncbi:hypothetical protein ACFVSW_15000 [Neobacillus sp. NPDC058068]|uniref:hypothetical protein n=1 Tax=Neobacillus sp. NPDC058068 TaxID=3346325 RepID=UPI0036DAB123